MSDTLRTPTPITLTLAADRAECLRQEIGKALGRGDVVTLTLTVTADTILIDTKHTTVEIKL